MKKNKTLWIGLALLLVFAIAYSSSSKEAPPINQPAPKGDKVTVEVYHFHGTHQCFSCIEVGRLAEKTITTYFQDELESGKLKFAHVNGELFENKELVERFGPTGSSIWIGTTIDGQFYKEQNTNVWYKIGNEADYLSYFKSVLEKRLGGDLSD